MGQRTQVIIKKEHKKVTIHNQWGYGRLLINACFQVLQSVDKNLVGFYALKYNPHVVWKTLSTIMSVNIEDNILTDFSPYTYDETNQPEFVPLNMCDNDDGWLILDLTDHKPKYAFIIQFIGAYKLITPREYFGRYMTGYSEETRTAILIKANKHMTLIERLGTQMTLEEALTIGEPISGTPQNK